VKEKRPAPGKARAVYVESDPMRGESGRILRDESCCVKIVLDRADMPGTLDLTFSASPDAPEGEVRASCREETEA
jgi:hypothetical protein